MSPTSLQMRIAAFEQAAADAVDPQMMAAKISEHSDRKKYDFCKGLTHDLQRTRTALRATASKNCCTFGKLYRYTEGRIANLNRVLQNMKQANEIHFTPECFFESIHDDEEIKLLEQFWREEYEVDEENVFRSGIFTHDIPEEDRKGRSYVAEDRETRNVQKCFACLRRVKAEERITIRARVFHLSCITCAVCGASLRQKKDYITFDGQICCSSECIQQYDGAHLRQQRL